LERPYDKYTRYKATKNSMARGHCLKEMKRLIFKGGRTGQSGLSRW
jgi:hypothetical protein